MKSQAWSRALFALIFLGTVPVQAAIVKRSKTADLDLSDIVRPQLVNAQTDPTLRFPIMCMSNGVTYGWLDITHTTVSYTEVVPTHRSNRAFVVSRFALHDLRFNRNMLSFRSPKKWESVIYVPPDEWGKVHMAFGGLNREVNQQTMGTSSIYKTLMNYDLVLAMVNPLPPPPAPVIAQPVAPPPKAIAPASPPAIVLSSPAGAGEGQTVELNESTVVIRGVAMDSTGIPVVTINGQPANMRPQTTQASEFWSDPLPLKTGSNAIQVVASNSAHLQAKVQVNVNFKPKTTVVDPRALDRVEIVTLLQGGVPPEHVADLVKQRGVKFSPNPDDISAVRAAGGTDLLIQAIQQVAPHP